MDIKNGKKKLTIKPFKVQPKLPENFEAVTWNKLKDAVVAVDKQVAVSYNKEELYQAVEDLCLHKSGPTVYEKLSSVCKGLIEARINTLSSKASLDHATYLQAVETIWTHHCEMMMTIRNIFLYLDRSYAMTQQNQLTPSGIVILTICDMGNYYFKQHLAQRKDIEDRIILALLSAVDVDRQSNNPRYCFQDGAMDTGGNTVGGIVAYDVMRCACRMLQALGLYASRFEPCLIKESNRFFEAESQELMSGEHLGGEGAPAGGMSVGAAQYYLFHVDYRMAQVGSMVNRYLMFESSRKALLLAIERTLLSPAHTMTLCDYGLPALLEAQAVADLGKLYSLLSRLSEGSEGVLNALCGQWGSYIRRVGETIIVGGLSTETSGSGVANKDAISDVLLLQDRMRDVLKVSFHNQDGFRAAYRGAFEHFLNSSVVPSAGSSASSVCSNRVSELLSKFCDKRLRSGGSSSSAGGMGDLDLEQTLDKCLSLFCYVSSKDIFEAFYRKHLSRRLLLGKSANEELERSVISKLKAECGANYTSKLEGMFTDMELSKDIMSQYSSYREGSAWAAESSSAAGSTGRRLDVHYHVLTTGFWPTPAIQFEADSKSVSQFFPQELRSAQDEFIKFYHEKYQGRRLSWSYCLDRCLVAARFPRGRKELEVSFHQALVLNCFNTSVLQGRAYLSYAEIKQLVPLADSELKRTILSLCNGPIGTRVLGKEPKGKELDTSVDKIRFNSEFVNKLFHIKINAIQLREAVDESDKVNEEVLRDRQYQIDAVAVRVMKARKRLGHNALISELLSQLKFPARPVDLKKRLESLIERDYLMRDTEDNNVYCYLA